MKNIPQISNRRLNALLAVSLVLIAPSAIAEETDNILPAEVPAVQTAEGVSPKHFLVEAGLVGQAQTDIDGGGEMQVNRFDAGLVFSLPVAEKTRIASSFLLGINDYDFDTDGFGDPWGTVVLSRIGAQMSQTLNETWTLRGGGVMMSSLESGADFGDSLTGGGTIGVDYRHSETLFLSIGAAIISQLEDDATITPMIAVNWQATDNWTLRLGALPVSGGAGAGVEGEYRIRENLAIGLGLLANQRRFRLDGSGPAPDGVGEENNLAIRARLGWRLSEVTSLHFIAGFACAGELRLEDRGGNKLGETDYDPAPYLALRALFRF